MRPAVSTEYIENDEPAARPTYRAYYPTRETRWATPFRVIVENFQLQREFADLGARHGLCGGRHAWAALIRCGCARNFQIQVLTSLFFRNKGAYVVGKIINGFHEVPFALPILHDDSGRLTIDAALFGEDDMQMLFSFARAYFHGGHGGAQRLRAVFAQPHAPQAAR